MATMRLYTDDKTKIIRAFDAVLERLPASHPFPVAPEDVREYFLALIPEETMAAWEHLEQYQRSTYRNGVGANWRTATGHSWYAEFWTDIPAQSGYEPGIVDVRVDVGDMPKLNFYMPDTHPDHPAIVAWAYEYAGMVEKVRQASSYVLYCVKHCNTAGQLMRLIPESIHYLPNGEVKQSIQQAERRSRMPVNFVRNTAKQEALVELMVLASLCPPSKGWAPFSNVNCRLTKKEAP